MRGKRNLAARSPLCCQRLDRRSLWGWLFVLLLLVLAPACGMTSRPGLPERPDGGPLNVVTTTNLLADVARQVGGERVQVVALMGPGVDPHLYKARESDVLKLFNADLVFYHGLFLEGKMAEILGQLNRWVPTYAVAEQAVPPDRLIYPSAFEGAPDPHVWMDVQLWMLVADKVAEILARHDPAYADLYQANAAAYRRELQALDEYVRQQVARVPPDQRVLITAHDAFNYFGRAYGFEVHGLQGISTAAEAGTADVQALANLIVERRIRAIFVESSVPVRYIEAVQEAVRARGWEVRIGGTLYSDSLGEPGTPAGTYTGMMRHNVDTIVSSLLGEEALERGNLVGMR